MTNTKTENKKNYYITFFGANAVGKSSTAGWISHHLRERGYDVLTIGTYKIRNGRKYHTGGSDGMRSKIKGGSITNEERLENLTLKWDSDAQIVIGLGMFMSSKSDINNYLLMKKLHKDRELIIFHLYADQKVLLDRITLRGNKPLTPIRSQRLKSRTKLALSALEPFRDAETPQFKIIDFDTSNPDSYVDLKKLILKELGVEWIL